MNSLKKIKIGDILELITDYHSNGAYKKLKENVELLDKENYAVMIRTLNFERQDFKDDLLYVTKKAYDFLEKSSVIPNDILMNKIANAGSVYIMPDMQKPVTCGMNLFLIRFNDTVNQRYMYYNMKNVEQYIKSFAHGTTTTTITKDEVRNIDLYIHSKKEQGKIEKLLTSIDKKIENNKKINSELESMAKTIYDYWFLQFEFPNEEGKPYKSSGGKMVWNEELGREIPEGWEVDSIINNRMVSVIKPGVSYFDNKNYLATANVTGNNITDGNWVTYENRESRANMQPILNSIWFAKMKNSIKHITLTDTCEWFVDKYILSTGFVGLKCNEISLEYMHCFINSDSFEYVKDMLSHGATQEAVNNDDLKSIKLIIPTDNYLRKFSEQVNSLIKLESKNIIENQQLSSLRDFLLPLLMNGQVGFKENINAKDIEFGKEEVLT